MITEDSEIIKLKLNSTWNFNYASHKEQDHHIPYSERLTKFAEFETLDQFYKYYIYIKSVNDKVIG